MMILAWLFRSMNKAEKDYETIDSEIDNEIDSFVVVDNHNDNLDLLNKHVDPCLMVRISKCQILADNYDQNRKNNVECCVCLSDTSRHVPISCSHPLCSDCYIDLINRTYFGCPLCNKEMELIDFEKFYVIVINVNNEISGMIYLPPIRDKTTNKLVDHDIFFGIYYDMNEARSFVETLKYANDQGYSIVPNNYPAFTLLKPFTNEYNFTIKSV